MFRLSNNINLPEASAFGVKSFWLMLVTVAVMALNAVGFDLVKSLCEVGLGCTADQIAAKGERTVNLIQQLLPILTAVWMWFERRAPQLRLVFWKKSAGTPVLKMFVLFGVLALFALGTAPAALAAGAAQEAPICQGPGFLFWLAVGGFGVVVSAGVSALFWLLLIAGEAINRTEQDGHSTTDAGWRSE